MYNTVSSTIDFCPIILSNLEKLIALYIASTFAITGKNLSIQMITSAANYDNYNNSSKAICTLHMHVENAGQLLVQSINNICLRENRNVSKTCFRVFTANLHTLQNKFQDMPFLICTGKK